MRFWAASAVVPLLFDEAGSREMSEALAADREMVVWWATRVECASAARRREREGAPTASVSAALRLLGRFARAWSEVLATDPVRTVAERLLAVHSLRAADSLQLAAALVWRGAATDPSELVCLDERLRDAAAREGFTLLPVELICP